jgi:putative glutamine amidotransferase
MSAPIIGLTTYRTPGQMTIYDGELAVLPAQYVEAVTRSGGLALLLPPQEVSSEQAVEIIRRLDGLLVTGGADINPARYGQETHPETAEPEDLRDNFEDALLTAALENGVPVLGVCRGAQMINVHLGGTLHQHLPEVVNHDRYRVGDGVFHAEEMTLSEGSELHRLLGSHAAGHVYHHQAIDQVAPGLTVTARGFDGTIQGIERAGEPWCLRRAVAPRREPRGCSRVPGPHRGRFSLNRRGVNHEAVANVALHDAIPRFVEVVRR